MARHKTDLIQIRVEPKVKQLAVRLAEEERRSVANYIENLLLKAEQEKKQRTAA